MPGLHPWEQRQTSRPLMNRLSAKRVGYELDCWATTGIDVVPLRQSFRAARWESSKNLKPIFANFEGKLTGWLSHSIGGGPTVPSLLPEPAPKPFSPSTVALTPSWAIIPISSKPLKSTAAAQFSTALEISPLVPATAGPKA